MERLKTLTILFYCPSYDVYIVSLWLLLQAVYGRDLQLLRRAVHRPDGPRAGAGVPVWLDWPAQSDHHTVQSQAHPGICKREGEEGREKIWFSGLGFDLTPTPFTI